MAFRVSAKQFRKLTKQSAPQKYGNRKTVVAGEAFDSAWEAQHWTELRQLESAGQIRNLKRQVRIPVVINGTKVCTFIADFTYEERQPREAIWGEDFVWKSVVADCKSEITRKEPYYRLKKRLLKTVNDIEILEVVKPRKRRK